ncbi:SpaA isopeptide-forming pilin-related protein [Enterococcus camelliae]|uniref:SpaA isopeptide-forming pilin-related protein n=1 Tax=Enterococcus camelliae TaxID=453959 RepID=A0ABW5THP2_9ENTE
MEQKQASGKRFYKLANWISLLILLVSYLAPIAQVGAVTQEDKGFAITSAKEIDGKKIKLSADVVNSSTENKTYLVAISPENSLTKEKNAPLKDKTGKEVGTYEVNGTGITFTISPNVQSSIEVDLGVANESLTEVTLTNDGKTTTIPLTTPEASATPATSEAATEGTKTDTTKTSESAKESTTTTSSTEEKKQTTTSSKETAKQAIKASDATIGNDISQYLPDSSKGTIVDSFSIDFTNKDGEVDPKDVTIATNIAINYNWSIPNELLNDYQLKNGDYFTFKLPSNVTYSAGGGSLGDYGSYTIDKDGLVTFTFNEKVEDESDIEGTFHYNQGKMNVTEPGKTEIVIPTTTGTPSQPVIVNPTGGTDISKSGKIDSATNGKNVTWTIDANTSQKELKNASIQENFPAGLTLTSSKVTLLNVGMDGTIIGVGDTLTQGTDYTIDAKGNITLIGKYANTRKAFRVTYETSIDDSAKAADPNKPYDGGKVSFTNNATLVNDGKEPIPAAATVTTTYGKMIDKAGQQAGENQQLNWTIKFNLGEKDLKPGNAVIVDTLDSNSSYVKNSIIVKTVNGEVVDPKTYEVSFDDTTNKMTINFKEGLKVGIIATYKSTYNAPLSSDGQTVKNEATGGGATTGETTGKISPTGVKKEIKNIDYNKRELSWSITFNQDRQKFHNLKITDSMGLGLSLIYPTDFVVTDLDTNQVVSTDKYKIDQTAASATVGENFVLSFTDKLTDEEHSHAYRIDYKTKVDYDLMTSGKFENNVSYDWIDINNQPHNSKQDIPFNPVWFVKDDGFKNGNYNAVTKEITWTVGINFQLHDLKNASIVDSIKKGQTYVDGSAVLNKITSFDAKGYTFVSTSTPVMFDATTQTLSTNLPEDNSAYLLIYKTSVDGTMITSSYANTATYTNNSNSKNFDATVSVKNGDELISKGGTQSTDDSSLVNWTLTLNASQSTISDASITDTPSANQTTDFSSIKIQQAGVNTDGSLTGKPLDGSSPLVLDTDYSIEQGENGTFTIKFLKTISNAYYITYNSIIDSDKVNDTLTNSVNLSGNGKTNISGDKTEEVDVINNGGSSSGSNYEIDVLKIDKDTEKVLPGATFELTKKNSDFKQVTTTNESGQINFGKLKSGTYYLKEITAPSGYVLSTEVKTILLSKTSTTNGKFAITQENEQMTGSVELTKTDSDTSKVLSGAVFTLFDETNQVVKDGLVTDKDGKISVSNLKPGNYYFVETAAPAGYEFDKDKKYEFTVELQTTAKVATVSATNAEKTGSVELTKTDSDTNKVLAGATFALYKADGTKLEEELQTNEQGKLLVDNLKPGNYYFKETAAPAGYEFDSNKEYNFTVELQTTAKVATVSATNTQKTGSVKLSKTDSDTGKALAGATFSIFKKDGTVVAKDLVTEANGELNYSGLKPGDYYFVETAAPAGYEFDKDKKYEFTVELQTETKVATVSATNAQKTGSVELTKLDDDTNKVLPGATFTLYDATDKVVKEGLVTGKDGKVSVDNLKPGNYYFKETAAPDGYDFDSTAKYPVILGLQVDNKPTPGTVVVGNAQTSGSIQLVKLDSDTEKPLPGATFDLYNAENEKIKSALTTDDNGTITVKNLKPGSYYFVETAAPAGYEFDKDAKYVANLPLQTTENKQVVKVTAENAQKTGSVVLTKMDSDTNKTLAGATFALYKADGTQVNVKDPNPMITNADGKLTVDNLKPGNYYFVETAAPAGYEFDADKKYEFTVELQTETKVATVSATNAQKTGSVVLTKTDSDTDKVLAGAIFALYKKDGTEVATDLKTNTKGQITYEGLKPGNYYFVETAAPAGYEFDKDKKYEFTVELQTETKVATVSVENAEKTGSVVLTKTDSATKQVLVGAVFTLFKADGTVVAKDLKTNTKGQITYEGLKPGSYYFKETIAPTGYQLDKDKKYSFTVELQTTSKVANVAVTNTKIPAKPINNQPNNGHKLPNTGQKTATWMTLLGVFLIVVVAGIWVVKRKFN